MLGIIIYPERGPHLTLEVCEDVKLVRTEYLSLKVELRLPI
jgi:hypothetical protein